MGVSISVIVPVYNSEVMLRQCLQALAKQETLYQELIVVDDGSSDASVDVARSFGAKVIKSGRIAGGPAHARNIAAQVATGHVLYFIDADCVLHDDAIERIIKHYEQDNPAEAIIGTYDLSPAADNFLSQFKNLFHAYVHQSASETAHTFWSGCGAIKRHVFLQMGGFDTVRYPRPSIEDIDLGYRMVLRGHRIRLDKQLHVKHLKKWTPISLIKTDVFDRAIPWTRLMLQIQNIETDLNLQRYSKLSVVAVAVLILSLLMTIFTPLALLITLPSMMALVVLNRDVYRYFLQQRGTAFMLWAMLWQWVYYFYSGVGFGLGFAVHLYDMMQGRSLAHRSMQPLVRLD